MKALTVFFGLSIAISNFSIFGGTAIAQTVSSCTASDPAAIVAGLDARTKNQDLSSGERDLARLIKGDIETGSLRSCSTSVTPMGELVYYVETPAHIAASILFSAVGSHRVIKVSAGWAK